MSCISKLHLIVHFTIPGYNIAEIAAGRVELHTHCGSVPHCMPKHINIQCHLWLRITVHRRWIAFCISQFNVHAVGLGGRLSTVSTSTVISSICKRVSCVENVTAVIFLLLVYYFFTSPPRYWRGVLWGACLFVCVCQCLSVRKHIFGATSDLRQIFLR